MNKIWKPLVLVLVIGIMAADMFFDYQVSAQVQADNAVTAGASHLTVGTTVGELAPDFTATTLDGQTIQLSELHGKVVLVNLFASWCGPCRAEMPHLVEAFHEYDPDKVAFVGLNLQEAPAAVAGFKDEFAIPFPLALDQDGRLTKNVYQPVGLPTSWFIDQDGVVRFVFTGPMNKAMLQQILDDVRAGREPNPFGVTG
jgi:thiol-disulfide isomerase/thioredoxin